MSATEQEIKALGRVAVLMGGCSAEREVSLKSGQAVLAALQAKGVNAFGLDLGKNALAQLLAEPMDRAFIALHGRGGEDGCIQGALEWLGVPYTGSDVMASALAMDKYKCKQVWLGQGLPTPASCLLTPESDPEQVVEHLGLPIMVKPAHEGSSLGMSKVDSAADLKAAWEEASHYDARVLAERYIQGAEFTVSIVGDQALPVIGLQTSHAFYDYNAKYVTGDTQYLLPSGLPDEEQQALQELALKAYQAVGCEGWGRVDIMVDAEGRPWLLEVNTSPGMTNLSLVPQAAAFNGMSFEELVLTLLCSARLKVFSGH
ncbi:D-alanine-D-alanine ligase [Marinospirillum celere]|uniref:D-alanine--D-alanine ligase n=1 Tax=Marinospirillum celere TaxID=1122252 RepID=A0A1I1FZ33_9GAMM|nr:D-alanine--D-alanine ligase [Marinospirillum celere]SFC04624.1 D-alanine-D-alanine ligase [Marinospirillum celere]